MKLFNCWKLKFYSKEEKCFHSEHYTYLNDIETKRVVRKMCQHYKFTVDILKFNAHKGHGFSLYEEKKIRVCHNPSYALVIHELAHQYDQQILKRPHSRHDKQLMHVITKFHKYCAKKNYWLTISE